MYWAEGRVVSNFIIQALSGEPITLYGNGGQTRSFCYLDGPPAWRVAGLIDSLVHLMDSRASFTGPVNLGNEGELAIR